MWKEHSSNSGETAALQKEELHFPACKESRDLNTVEMPHVQSLYPALGVKYPFLVTSSEAKLARFHPSCQHQTDGDFRLT